MIASRMPLGRQQLGRQRTSTLLALAGVTASLVVIFAQLGIERAVYDSSVRIHRAVVSPLVLVPPGFKSMQLHAEVQTSASDIVSAHPEVAVATPLTFGIMSLTHAGMAASRRIAWYAIDVERPAIAVPGLADSLHKLRVPRTLLFDALSRPVYGDLLQRMSTADEVLLLGPPDARMLLREMFAVGAMRIGPNVLNDGNVLMSDHSMVELFGSWYADRPALVGLGVRPGVDLGRLADELNKALAGRGEVITRAELERRERAYWSRETPVGYITDMGFILGLMIGMVFIYYAQYQIIRTYLPEYAILKSLGYGWWFFFCMVGQIGAAIITPAFLVALALGRGVYAAAESAMHLGLSMGLREMGVALTAALIMTAVSSAFAIRRLWRVDPIMLFE